MQILTNEVAVILALGEGPSCGVGIMDRVRAAGSSGHALGAGTLYPLLRRLEKGGLVHSWLERERSGVGRPRRFLELTARGIAEFGRVLEELRAVDAGPVLAPLPATGRGMRANLRRACLVSAFAGELRDARARG